MTFNDDDTEIRNQNNKALIRVYRSYFFMGVIIALASPLQVLQSFSLLRSVIEFASSLVPAITRIASASDMPDVVQVYWTLMWIGLPIVTVRVASYWTYSPEILRAGLWRKVKLFLMCLFLNTLFGWFVIFFGTTTLEIISELHGRGGVFMRVITHSRIGLAILGGLSFCCFSSFFGVSVRLLGIWLLNSIRKKA